MYINKLVAATLLLVCCNTAEFSTLAFCEEAGKPKVTTLELPYLSDYPGTDENVITDLKKHQAIMFTFRRGPDSNVSGVFIEQLVNQKSLEVLSLKGEGWQLNETHLEWISKVQTLDALYLESDRLTDDAIQHLSQLSGLKRLQISSEMITDEGVANALQNLSLERLIVNGKKIRGTFLNQLKNAGTITSLSLAHTGIDEESFAALSKVPSLQNLTLSGCHKLTDQTISTLVLNETLETLVLNDTQVGEQTLSKLVTYPRLERLYLSETSVADSQMTYLAFMPGLERVILDHTEITSKGIVELSKSQSIKHLSVNDCQHLDSACIRTLQKMNNLASLEIRRSGIRRTTISRLRKARPFLTVDWSK